MDSEKMVKAFSDKERRRILSAMPDDVVLHEAVSRGVDFAEQVGQEAVKLAARQEESDHHRRRQKL